MPSGMDSIPPKMSLKWNLDAKEFVPEKYRFCYEVDKAKSSIAVQELRKVIETLTVEPAEFYDVLVPLVSVLEKEIKSENVLKAVVEVLLEKSIVSVGFRYSGARMCSYLSQHLKVMTKSNFLQELVIRCLKEHDTILTGGGYQSITHLIGFTLFMGELLMNMLEVKEIWSTFPTRLQELLVTLTSHQSDEALLCVIQSLKLTGAKLDELVPIIDEVYLEIGMFIGYPNISERIQVQLQFLLDLRSRGWEKNLNDTKTTERNEEPSQDVSPDGMEPVYFDADGQGYYIDEVEALENLKLSEDADENTYFIGDNPMDQETAKDFEDFVAQLPSLGDDRVPDPPTQPSTMHHGGYAPPQDAHWMPDAARWPALSAPLDSNAMQQAAGYPPFEFYEGLETGEAGGRFPPLQSAVPIHHQPQFTTAPLHPAGYAAAPVGLHGSGLYNNELPTNGYLSNGYPLSNGLLGGGLQHNGWPSNEWMGNRPLNNGWQLSETLNNGWVGNETLPNGWPGGVPRTVMATTPSQFITPSNGMMPPNAAASYFHQ